jgi:hypothetical protein
VVEASPKKASNVEPGGGKRVNFAHVVKESQVGCGMSAMRGQFALPHNSP